METQQKLQKLQNWLKRLKQCDSKAYEKLCNNLLDYYKSRDESETFKKMNSILSNYSHMVEEINQNLLQGTKFSTGVCLSSLVHDFFKKMEAMGEQLDNQLLKFYDTLQLTQDSQQKIALTKKYLSKFGKKYPQLKSTIDEMIKNSYENSLLHLDLSHLDQKQLSANLLSSIQKQHKEMFLKYHSRQEYNKYFLTGKKEKVFLNDLEKKMCKKDYQQLLKALQPILDEQKVEELGKKLLNSQDYLKLSLIVKSRQQDRRCRSKNFFQNIADYNMQTMISPSYCERVYHCKTTFSGETPLTKSVINRTHKCIESDYSQKRKLNYLEQMLTRQEDHRIILDTILITTKKAIQMLQSVITQYNDLSSQQREKRIQQILKTGFIQMVCTESEFRVKKLQFQSKLVHGNQLKGLKFILCFAETKLRQLIKKKSSLVEKWQFINEQHWQGASKLVALMQFESRQHKITANTNFIIDELNMRAQFLREGRWMPKQINNEENEEQERIDDILSSDEESEEESIIRVTQQQRFVLEKFRKEQQQKMIKTVQNDESEQNFNFEQLHQSTFFNYLNTFNYCFQNLSVIHKDCEIKKYYDSIFSENQDNIHLPAIIMDFSDKQTISLAFSMLNCVIDRCSSSVVQRSTMKKSLRIILKYFFNIHTFDVHVVQQSLTFDKIAKIIANMHKKNNGQGINIGGPKDEDKEGQNGDWEISNFISSKIEEICQNFMELESLEETTIVRQQFFNTNYQPQKNESNLVWFTTKSMYVFLYLLYCLYERLRLMKTAIGFKDKQLAYEIIQYYILGKQEPKRQQSNDKYEQQIQVRIGGMIDYLCDGFQASFSFKNMKNLLKRLYSSLKDAQNSFNEYSLYVGAQKNEGQGLFFLKKYGETQMMDGQQFVRVVYDDNSGLLQVNYLQQALLCESETINGRQNKRNENLMSEMIDEKEQIKDERQHLLKIEDSLMIDQSIEQQTRSKQNRKRQEDQNEQIKDEIEKEERRKGEKQKKVEHNSEQDGQIRDEQVDKMADRQCLNAGKQSKKKQSCLNGQFLDKVYVNYKPLRIPDELRKPESPQMSDEQI